MKIKLAISEFIDREGYEIDIRFGSVANHVTSEICNRGYNVSFWFDSLPNMNRFEKFNSDKNYKIVLFDLRR